MRPMLLFTFLMSALTAHSQPNCLVFKEQGQMKRYQACEKSKALKGHYQFSREFQEILDEVLEIDSTFAYAYRAKSVAYLKSGDFIQWKKLMDQAVKYDPQGMLGYRGWCRYQFFRDYSGAIADLEQLTRLVDHDIGYSVTGEYHLKVALDICYGALGEQRKAIESITEHLKKEKHFIGLYDYLHLAVLHLELGEYNASIQALKKQIGEFDLAEVHYYLGLNYRQLSRIRADQEKARQEKELALNEFLRARDLYEKGNRMRDGYSHPMHKIFLAEIENEITLLAVQEDG